MVSFLIISSCFFPSLQWKPKPTHLCQCKRLAKSSSRSRKTISNQICIHSRWTVDLFRIACVCAHRLFHKRFIPKWHVAAVHHVDSIVVAEEKQPANILTTSCATEASIAEQEARCQWCHPWRHPADFGESKRHKWVNHDPASFDFCFYLVNKRRNDWRRPHTADNTGIRCKRTKRRICHSPCSFRSSC